MDVGLTSTPRELLPEFYRQYELGEDGGNQIPFVKIKITGRISLYIPNIEARKKVVFKHDIHHIVTGYTSTFKGETEIGGWEIGSGCLNYWIAFALNLSGVMSGIFFNLRGVFRAFVKGRRTKNLYGDSISDERVMDMTIQQIRQELFLDTYKATAGNLLDFLLFILLIVVGVIYTVLSVVLIPYILIYSLYVAIKYRNQMAADRSQPPISH